MKFVETKTVTVDENVLNVQDLPDDIKNLVEIYDEVRKDCENARVEYIKCQAAMRDLSNQIATAIQSLNANKKPHEEPTLEEPKKLKSRVKR